MSITVTVSSMKLVLKQCLLDSGCVVRLNKYESLVNALHSHDIDLQFK